MHASLPLKLLTIVHAASFLQGLVHAQEVEQEVRSSETLQLPQMVMCVLLAHIWSLPSVSLQQLTIPGQKSSTTSTCSIRRMYSCQSRHRNGG